MVSTSSMESEPNQQYCGDELTQDRNVYERIGRPPTRDTLQDKLDALDEKANSGSKCAIMTTYCGDRQIGVNKTMR